VRDISKIIAPTRGFFGVGLLNDISQSLPRPTLVAMATKFELKLAISYLICEISRRSLRQTGGFRGRAIERCQSKSIATNPGCHNNEIGAKIGYNSAYMRDLQDPCVYQGEIMREEYIRLVTI